MAAVTEVTRLAISSSDREYYYSDISTWDGTTIADEDLLQVYDNSTLLTLTTHYTVDPDTHTVNLNPAYTITAGDRITIRRVTDIDTPYVDFENNSGIDASHLDLAIGQNRFKLQEPDTGLTNTLGLDTINDCWDAESKQICNLASATSSTDAVNYGQVVSLISGGDPMDTGVGIYAEADGTGAETIFELPTFPTTDVNAKKLIVTIDGIKQRPDVDYEYYLDASTPTARFLIEAPPLGTGNIQFHTLPGVVTSTYGAESIDGSSIVVNTLDGDRVINATLDGDALIDGSTPVTKLEAAEGSDDRAILFNAAGTPSIQTLTNDEITHTGAGGRTDIGEAQVVEVLTTPVAFNVAGSSYSWTNSGSTTVFVCSSWRVLYNSGTVGMFNSDWADEIKLFSWNAENGVWRDMHCSFFLPPGATAAWRGAGQNTMERIVTQEV